MRPSGVSNVLTITLLWLSGFAANAEPVYLFTNGHLITMASPDPIQADLLVREGRIKTVGRDLGTNINTTVIDMRGGYGSFQTQQRRQWYIVLGYFE